MPTKPARARGGSRGRPEQAARGAHLVLMIDVARRYYLHQRSKVEIAKELDLSRFQVARLLDSARANGLVYIDIRYPAPLNTELAEHIRDTFDLYRVIVVNSPDGDVARVRETVGQAAAEFLGEIIVPTDILGLGLARTVNSMAKKLTRLPAIPVVQLTGAVTGPNGADSSIDVVREVARRSTGPAYFFHAPLVVPTASTARSLRVQPEVAGAFEQFPHVTKAVVGIGLWQNGYSTLHDALGGHDREELGQRGAFADLSGVVINSDGEPVISDITNRMIRIGLDELRSIRDVIGIAYQTEKAPAVRAAIKSGIVNSLVLDARVAEALLDFG
jgi:DNA-binding transcriptional regulator LsrR (DeoR family)